MRRVARAPLAATLSLAAVALAGCAQTPPASGPVTTPAPSVPSASATASAPPTAAASPSVAHPPTCPELAAGMTPRERAGQLVMMGVTGGLDAAEARTLSDGAFGSVILMGSTTDGVAGTRGRTDAIQEAGGGAVLVAVDQEGGLVQRLKGPGFDTMPSASEQAELGPTELTAAAARWGKQMVDAGVHLDLAPVADVVPADKLRSNEPIGKLGRGYGTTPDEVAENVAAVVAGFREAGLSASPKHFPNLGQVVGNTDFTAKVVDDVTTADAGALAPYRRLIADGVETVMVGTAWYTHIDADAPAAFSPAVIGVLREDLGFTGVVVSDDLGVAKAVADVPAAQRAVRFVRAGGDLAISVDAPAALAMVQGLAEATQGDEELAAQVTAAAGRVLALKAAHGLASCEPVLG